MRTAACLRWQPAGPGVTAALLKNRPLVEKRPFFTHFPDWLIVSPCDVYFFHFDNQKDAESLIFIKG